MPKYTEAFKFAVDLLQKTAPAAATAAATPAATDAETASVAGPVDGDAEDGDLVFEVRLQLSMLHWFAMNDSAIVVCRMSTWIARCRM